MGLDNVNFVLGDCRYYQFETKAKTIVCLYDVIGSYANEDENIKILKRMSDSLEDGGNAIISVMNYELTQALAKHTFKLSETPNVILNLPTSNIMEKTGNIFDPDYYFIDEETEIVYRKERFDQGNDLPIELIVRDKRYTKSEIVNLCKSVGLKVEFARYVNARNWKTELDPTDKRAKEILIKCVKI